MVPKHWKYIVVALLVLIVCVSAYPRQSSPSITLSMSEANVGDSITITGSNFSSPPRIDTEGDIRWGNSDIWTHCPSTSPTHSNNGYHYEQSYDGTFTLTMRIPKHHSSMDGGSKLFTITDTEGKSASALLTIRPPTVQLTQISSGGGTTVHFNGYNFAPFTGGGIAYMYGSKSRNVAGWTSDGAGAFASAFQVPTDVDPGSSNEVLITYTSKCSSNSTDQMRTHEQDKFISLLHSVPTPQITISPSSGASDRSVSISGTNFPGFKTLKVYIGDIDITPAPVPATNAAGEFSDSIWIPRELTPIGGHTVRVVQNSTEASTTYTLNQIAPTPTPYLAPQLPTPTPVYVYVYPPTPVPQPTPIPAYIATDDMRVETKVKEPLGGNLVRIFNFSNRTKTWSFYDPDPDLAGINTLQTVASGEVYWIKVYADAVVTLNNKPRQLYSGWNLVAY